MFLILFILPSFVFCSLYDGINDLPKDRFSTKTGYFNSYKDGSFWHEYNSKVSDCSATKVWFLTRHGTRYPVKDDYEKFSVLTNLSDSILYNHLQGRGSISETEVFEFKQWQPPFSIKDKGQLHEKGAEEMYDIGSFWKELFPNIFTDPYKSKEIKIQFTTRNRTEQSAYHFLRGMYGDDEVGKIRLPKAFTPNFVLRFYKACPRWLNEVYRNNKTYKEVYAFESSAEFQEMVQSISEKLGYVYPLSRDEILAMYFECRYEFAWWSHYKSIWCLPFTNRDIEILEYHQDLKYYYEDAYGTPMNEFMACETIGDLHEHLRKAAEDDEPLPRGVLYFSHDKAMLHIHNTLGLFKPEIPLRHDNFHEQKHRKFRTSVIAPFSTNLGFVVFKCGGNPKVVLFFQGNPTPMSHICKDLFCDWHELSSYLSPIHQKCDLPGTCRIHDEL